MYDSLDEQKMVGSGELMFRWLLVVLVSVAVFGGLYLAVYFMQG